MKTYKCVLTVRLVQQTSWALEAILDTNTDRLQCRKVPGSREKEMGGKEGQKVHTEELELIN